MMTDQEFINSIWNKYDNYMNKDINDKFFGKHQYKNLEFNRRLSFICNFIFFIIATVGVVYAGITSYDFIQKSTKTDFNKNSGYDYNQNMTYDNGIYYKKIYTYEEYIEAQNIWNNLVDMKPEDFENSFIIILTGENYDTTSLYISNIYVQEQKLYIELRKKDVWSIEDTTISAKISRELDREQLKIVNVPNSVDTSDKYVDINSLSESYSIEEAIEDHCFVVKENKIVSNNKKQLNDFVNKCNNQVSDVIRIYIKEVDRIIIYDIQYKNKKINMVSKSFYGKNERTLYYTGNKITSRQNDIYIEYSLYDEMKNQVLFCIVEI